MIKKAIILTIGNEILSGDVLDENSNWIAKKLFSFGVELEFIFTIPDKENIIRKFLLDYKDKYNFVFTIGGMGPTPDDVTKLAIANTFNCKLVKNSEVIELIKNYYGNNVSEEKLILAIMPEKSKPIFTSDKLWAVGIITENVYSFPGTPKLLKDSFSTIENSFKSESIIYKSKLNINCEETKFSEIMKEICNKYNDVDIGSYPSINDFRNVKIIFKSRSIESINNARQEFINKLINKLGNNIEIS
ncbi:MAG: competence/damage-inducible protein A [Candidatus Sericytochromatia bacterium]|nr:MAG: competence/damage-inducible protein A [Candidatus Sericytochromatia bacterium]